MLPIAVALWLLAPPALALTVVLDFEDQPLGGISEIQTDLGLVTFDHAEVIQLGLRKAVVGNDIYIGFPLMGDAILEVANPTTAVFWMRWIPIDPDLLRGDYVGEITGNPRLIPIRDVNGIALIRAVGSENDWFEVEAPWGIDSVSFTAIPEASSLVLGLLGVGLLFAGRGSWNGRPRKQHREVPLG